MTELVVFDCDGVLIDSEYLAAREESRRLGSLGFSLTPADVTQRYSGLSEASMASAIEKERGKPLPAAFFETLAARMRASFEAELEPIAGITEALSGLSIPKCVASSSDLGRLRHTLSLVGLYSTFAPHIYSADSVVLGKPAPDLFLYAARKMDAPPRNCVVVEDSPYGVEAACAAGMAALGFIGGRHCNEERGALLSRAGASEVFSNMAELPRLLSKTATS